FVFVDKCKSPATSRGRSPTDRRGRGRGPSPIGNPYTQPEGGTTLLGSGSSPTGVAPDIESALSVPLPPLSAHHCQLGLGTILLPRWLMHRLNRDPLRALRSRGPARALPQPASATS
ncbi:hypothetical protein CFOL_v3_09601, partial [Cephalotus follicularis]